jgi:SAM-dependent methyltransferase
VVNPGDRVVGAPLGPEPVGDRQKVGLKDGSNTSLSAAVEPSAVMRAQRRAGAARCVVAAAESLPFEDRSFDAAVAFSTVHHWHDPIARASGDAARSPPRGGVHTRLQ